MSNLSVISLVNGGNPVSAPRIYALSTDDTYATVTTAGYLSDRPSLFKAGDIVFITTDLTTTAATYQGYVTVSGSVISFTQGVLGGGGGGGSVSSVFSRTGSVVAANNDYSAGQIKNVAAGGIASTNVQDAINELDTEKASLASPTFTGTLEGVNATFTGVMGATTATVGSLNLSPLGGTINVATGTNSCAGTLTLNGATPVVVSTSAVTTNSIILLTRQTVAGTPATFNITAKTPGASFTVTGVALDTSTVGYLIIN
jgi:hypothetical protein